MMINVKQIFHVGLLLSLLCVCSCGEKIAQEDDSPEIFESGEYERVTMVIPSLSYDDYPMTKVNVDFSTFMYLWEETDTVGIFPNRGSQIYFSMEEGVGKSEAVFDGGGWALKKNSSYYSYFPFVADYYIDKENIPVTYLGQEQEGNSSLTVSSLGKYSYMVAEGVADANTGNLTFVYERLQKTFQFIIPVEAGTYTSLDICAGSDVIPVSGTVNAMSADAEIHNPVYDDHLSISLKNVTFDTPEVLKVVCVIPPFDIFAQQMTMNLTKSDGTVVTSSAFGKTFVLGGVARVIPNFSVSPAIAELPGDGGSFDFRITASATSTYSITSDVDWLTIMNHPTSGSATVSVSAGKGEAKKRTGHIMVSEYVDYKGTVINLVNKIEVTQDIYGMSMGVGGWDEDGEDYGGSAQ